MDLIAFVDSTKETRLTHFFLNKKSQETIVEPYLINSDYPRSFEKSLK